MTTLYIMVGAPGCGKSYFAKKYLYAGKQHIAYISRDIVRYSMINDNEAYFSKEDDVFTEFVRQIKYHLDIEANAVIADATHLNWPSRRKLLNALGLINNSRNNVAIIPVVIKTDEKINIARNNERTGRACVPYDVLMKMRNSQTSPWGDPFKYTAIMEVNNNGDN